MKVKLAILLIFLLALTLRLLYFRDSVTFFYDQARDAFASMEIWQGDPIKVLGPPTDFPGLHHGPFYYYLISPFYFFTGGNVWVVRFVLILLNSLNIFFIYDLAKSLFKNKFISLLSIAIYAVSFEATQYGRWISDPGPILLTATISFWSLQKLIEGKKWALLTLLVSWGLSIQLDVILLYQVLVFPVIWLLNKGFKLPQLPIKHYALALGGFFLVLSSFLAAEVRFNFQGALAFLSFLKTQNLYDKSFLPSLAKITEQLTEIFYLNVWGLNLFLAGMIMIFSLYYSYNYIKAHKSGSKSVLFLIIWMLSPIILSLFTGTNAHFVTVGSSVAVIILSSFLIWELYTKTKNRWILGLVIFIVLVGNLILVVTKNKDGEVLFQIQHKVLLGDELKVIDWVYGQSQDKPFRINTITNPLFINTTWALLFNWYGKSHYGYMPIWWGEAQVGVAGANVKFSEPKDTDIHYLIIEPSAEPDDKYIKTIRFLEDSRSKVIETKKIGAFIVEKRQITKPDRVFTNQDVFYILLNSPEKQINK